MNETEARKALCALVKPWLPKATIDEFDVDESCHCYSDYTQQAAHFWLTFNVPWRKHNEALAKVVSVIEPMVKLWAQSNYHFRGCSSCCGRLNFFVRAIPVRKHPAPTVEDYVSRARSR